jgi:hypothetical protein
MIKFPVKVKWRCKISNFDILFTIPDGFTLQAGLPNIQPTHYSIEDMKKKRTSVLVKNHQNQVVAKQDIKDVAVKIFCKKCEIEHTVLIRELEFL